MNNLPLDLRPLPTMPYNERPESLPLVVEECRTALWRCKGNVTKAAELLKITPRRLRAFIKNSVYLTGEVAEASEQLKDRAMDVVNDALHDEEDKGRRDSMAKFVLANLGADRGFGTKGAGISLQAPKSGRVVISWEDGENFNEPPVIDGEIVDAA